VTGTTDADGYTQWLERDAAERLAFDVMENPV
jgi:YD repeat-containing protein